MALPRTRSEGDPNIQIDFSLIVETISIGPSIFTSGNGAGMIAVQGGTNSRQRDERLDVNSERDFSFDLIGDQLMRRCIQRSIFATCPTTKYA